MPENLLYRVTTDANARYVGQSGILDEMGIFEILTESPKFRKAKPFVRWLHADISRIDVFEWSIEMELTDRIARKTDHQLVERMAKQLNGMHTCRRES